MCSELVLASIACEHRLSTQRRCGIVSGRLSWESPRMADRMTTRRVQLS